MADKKQVIVEGEVVYAFVHAPLKGKYDPCYIITLDVGDNDVPEGMKVTEQDGDRLVKVKVNVMSKVGKPNAIPTVWHNGEKTDKEIYKGSKVRVLANSFKGKYGITFILNAVNVLEFAEKAERDNDDLPEGFLETKDSGDSRPNLDF